VVTVGVTAIADRDGSNKAEVDGETVGMIAQGPRALLLAAVEIAA